MKRDLFESIINQAKDFTEEAVFHVLGEPLLHPEIGHFIDYAHAAGMSAMITTNGTLLAGPEGSLLSGRDIRLLNISLHAYNEVDNPESYLKNIFDFIDGCITGGSRTQINLRLWNTLAAENTLIIEKINTRFGCSITPPTRLDDFRMNKVRRIAGEVNLHFDTQFEWPDISSAEKYTRGFCYGLISHYGVLVDGTVIPCCLDAEGAIPLGNINKTGLSEILSSGRAASIAEGFHNGIIIEDLCKRCSFAKRFIRKTRHKNRNSESGNRW